MSFLEIFAPSLRHLREERARQRHDVAHPALGAPPLGIDLDAGTARITIPLSRSEPHRPTEPTDPLLSEVGASAPEAGLDRSADA